MMPKLSIITINYNDAKGLELTIRSVVDQIFSDYEFIVIDGASTDASVEVIKKYQDKISYWVSEKDKGIYNAQNKGILIAKGDYCLFLNSGDYLKDNKVLSTVFSKNPSEDIVYGDMIIDYGSGELIYGTHPKKITFDFLIHTTLWHPVSFIKRKLFDLYGLYNEKWKIISDYDFFLKTIIVEGVSTRYIAIPVSVFNTDGIGSSPDHEALHQQERKLVQEKYFDKKLIAESKKRMALKIKKGQDLSEFFTRNKRLKKIVLFFYNKLKKKRS
ncbi:MAG: glycosyltransferase [Bacteroidetes bacterium]|nr:glycosyltransferase [Bacteroidota bacterium]